MFPADAPKHSRSSFLQPETKECSLKLSQEGKRRSYIGSGPARRIMRSHKWPQIEFRKGLLLTTIFITFMFNNHPLTGGLVNRIKGLNRNSLINDKQTRAQHINFPFPPLPPSPPIFPFPSHLLFPPIFPTPSQLLTPIPLSPTYFPSHKRHYEMCPLIMTVGRDLAEWEGTRC